MTFKCPYTEQCRIEGLREFAAMPELAAIFQSRLQCTEGDPSRARRCATRLGVTEITLPSFGGYIQERRREQQLPQAEMAREVGIELQVLRDIELNNLPAQRLSRQVVERIAEALSAPVEYLAALARVSTPGAVQRHGTSFARIVPSSEETQEPPA